MMKYVVGLVVIILIAGGVYYYWYMAPAAPAPAEQQNQQATTPSNDQVQGQDAKIGTGKEATPGSIVTIEYEGRFQDGKVFDSSASRGQPLVFQLGAQGIIPGFQIGVNGMKEGGERTILIPPSLGYGAVDVKDPQGTVLIPANSTLIFRVTLLQVEAAPAAPAE